MGFAVTEEAMEDNLYVQLSARYTKALARAMAYTKQVKAALPLNNGFSSFQSGDGVSLFNTAHPLVNGGTNSNRPTTGADLNEASLEDAIIQIGENTLSCIYCIFIYSRIFTWDNKYLKFISSFYIIRFSSFIINTC